MLKFIKSIPSFRKYVKFVNNPITNSTTVLIFIIFKIKKLFINAYLNLNKKQFFKEKIIN
jgi:hypothetical protein